MVRQDGGAIALAKGSRWAGLEGAELSGERKSKSSAATSREEEGGAFRLDGACVRERR
jgi:hypothetical protein